MGKQHLSRCEFLARGGRLALGAAGVAASRDVVSIVRIRKGKVDAAVEEAMDLIIAGTNPLATDMVAAGAMGIEPDEVPTFTTAHRIGMTPTRLDQIEIRGARLDQVRRRLVRPQMATWNQIRPCFGAREL